MHLQLSTSPSLFPQSLTTFPAFLHTNVFLLYYYNIPLPSLPHICLTPTLLEGWGPFYKTHCHIKHRYKRTLRRHPNPHTPLLSDTDFGTFWFDYFCHPTLPTHSGYFVSILPHVFSPLTFFQNLNITAMWRSKHMVGSMLDQQLHTGMSCLSVFRKKHAVWYLS